MVDVGTDAYAHLLLRRGLVVVRLLSVRCRRHLVPEDRWLRRVGVGHVATRWMWGKQEGRIGEREREEEKEEREGVKEEQETKRAREGLHREAKGSKFREARDGKHQSACDASLHRRCRGAGDPSVAGVEQAHHLQTTTSALGARQRLQLSFSSAATVVGNTITIKFVSLQVDPAYPATFSQLDQVNPRSRRDPSPAAMPSLVVESSLDVL